MKPSRPAPCCQVGGTPYLESYRQTYRKYPTSVSAIPTTTRVIGLSGKPHPVNGKSVVPPVKIVVPLPGGGVPYWSCAGVCANSMLSHFLCGLNIQRIKRISITTKSAVKKYTRSRKGR